jgi:uroporphyrinogen decarboxylase
MSNFSQSSFLSALNLENKSQIPVWFMRQAGRYLPEYMAVKKQSNFRTMSHTPEIMKEITLQPMRKFPLDASIMFSDILTCLEFMGSTFEFTDLGPKLANPGIETVKKLTSLDPEKDMMFVRDGIKLIKKELTDRPLIGFVGAPFTLISYLAEGGTSKEFIITKRFLFEDPKGFHAAMEHISLQISKYLKFQIESGVQAVQIFDSWVGVLSQKEYENFILPHMKNLISEVKKTYPQIPVILYSQPTSHLVALMAQTGANALSVDWRTPLSEISKKIPQNIALQGNVDPIVMTLDWEKAKPYVEAVLSDARRAEILDRFVFNVGHGVTPHTNNQTVAQTIDYVHNYR